MLPTQVVELSEARQTATFEIGTDDAVPSVLRGFSAPVILRQDLSAADRALLLAHDTDPFVKWESGRMLAKNALVRMVLDRAGPDTAYLDALGPVIRDTRQDPAFRAMVLGLPTDDDMAQTLADSGTIPDPAVIAAARLRMQDAMATRLEADLAALPDEMAVQGPYSPDADAAGRRALRNAALGLLSRRDGGARARAQFDAADNMTDEVAALSALQRIGAGAEETAAFHERWKGDRLVMDKWFTLQVLNAPGETGAAVTRTLTEHPAFDWKNPNRFRAVIGALGANHAGFHAADGAGYALVADWLIRLDPLNPQTAARMTTMFETWRRYDADRQALMREALQRIAATPGLSRDTAEMVDRMLGQSG